MIRHKVSLCMLAISIMIFHVSVIADVDVQRIWRSFVQKFIAIRDISAKVVCSTDTDTHAEISFDLRVMNLHNFWLKFTTPELLKGIILVVDTDNRRIYSSYLHKGTVIKRNIPRKEIEFYNDLFSNIVTFLTHINSSDYILSSSEENGMLCFSFFPKSDTGYQKISIYLSSESKMLKEIRIWSLKDNRSLSIHFSDIKLHDKGVKEYFNASLPYPLEYLP